MKGFVSMGTLVFVTFLFSIIALSLSIFVFLRVQSGRVIADYVSVKPKTTEVPTVVPTSVPTTVPTVTASPSAAVIPLKKTTVPVKIVSPTVALPTE